MDSTPPCRACGLASDADTWIVPAKALWRALHHANALDTYGLD